MKFQIGSVLYSKLKKIDHPISDALIALERKKCELSINFFDFTYTEGMVSYLKIRWCESEELLYDSNRREMVKIGRLVRILSKYLDIIINDVDIETFVNLYKASQIENAEFKLVTGDDIDYWYHVRSYESKDIESNNSLHESCMREKINFFSVYKESNCSLLCLIKDNKLVGRAILWNDIELCLPNGDKKNIKFLDRIYFTKQSLVSLFKDYAIANSIFYIGHNVSTITNGNETYSNYILKQPIPSSVLQKNKPYVDTLRRLFEEYVDGNIKHYLSNYPIGHMETWNTTTGGYDKNYDYISIKRKIEIVQEYCKKYKKETNEKYEIISKNEFIIGDSLYYVSSILSEFYDIYKDEIINGDITVNVLNILPYINKKLIANALDIDIVEKFKLDFSILCSVNIEEKESIIRNIIERYWDSSFSKLMEFTIKLWKSKEVNILNEYSVYSSFNSELRFDNLGNKKLIHFNGYNTTNINYYHFNESNYSIYSEDKQEAIDKLMYLIKNKYVSLPKIFMTIYINEYNIDYFSNKLTCKKTNGKYRFSTVKVIDEHISVIKEICSATDILNFYMKYPMRIDYNYLNTISNETLNKMLIKILNKNINGELRVELMRNLNIPFYNGVYLKKITNNKVLIQNN